MAIPTSVATSSTGSSSSPWIAGLTIAQTTGGSGEGGTRFPPWQPEASTSAPSTANSKTLTRRWCVRGGSKRSTRRKDGSDALRAPPDSAADDGMKNVYWQLYDGFYEFNEGLRFFVSGSIGNVIFFFIERLLSLILSRNFFELPTVLQDNIDGVTFFMAYVLQIVSQHWLHAFLVYGLESISTREKYMKTLVACYSTYMTSLVGSTILNTMLIKRGVDKTLSFCVTMFIFACVNYCVLKVVASSSPPTTSGSGKEEDPEERHHKNKKRWMSTESKNQDHLRNKALATAGGGVGGRKRVSMNGGPIRGGSGSNIMMDLMMTEEHSSRNGSVSADHRHQQQFEQKRTVGFPVLRPSAGLQQSQDFGL